MKKNFCYLMLLNFLIISADEFIDANWFFPDNPITSEQPLYINKNHIYIITLIDQVLRNIRTFGGGSIDKELFDFIRQILPDNKTILEFGSGWGSGELSKYYTVFSVEHDKRWLNKYKTHYIYAPIKNGWYDIEVLKKQLPIDYDLILIDGPPRTIGREGFYKNLALFKTNIPIIFDDIHRLKDYQHMINVAQILNREPKIFSTRDKQFGVLLPLQYIS